MRFGPTLAGAAAGALIGILLHLAVEVYGGLEAPWFAIIVGLLVGLLVRKLDKSSVGHVSYLRGAIAGVAALCAIVVSTYLVGVALTERAALASAKPIAAATDSDQEAADKSSAMVEGEAPLLESKEAPSAPIPAANKLRASRAGDLSIWQFIFMAVGTLIAYELARGTARTTVTQLASVEGAPAPP
jgi:hypothetical protein